MNNEKKNEERKQPGDVGYKGGVTNTTVRIDGKNYNVRTERDSNGNIISVIQTPKIFGIF